MSRPKVESSHFGETEKLCRGCGRRIKDLFCEYGYCKECLGDTGAFDAESDSYD
jgi:hypothetical protein